MDTLQQISRAVNGLRVLAGHLESEAALVDGRACKALSMKAREIDALCQGFERRLCDIRLLSLTRAQVADGLACGLLAEIRSDREVLRGSVRRLRQAVKHGDSWVIEEFLSESWHDALLEALEGVTFSSQAPRV